MKTSVLMVLILGFTGFTGIVFAAESPDPSFFRDLQKGETISNPEVTIIIESLGAILIVSFIIFYYIKKRIAKKNVSETK